MRNRRCRTVGRGVPLLLMGGWLVAGSLPAPGQTGSVAGVVAEAPAETAGIRLGQAVLMALTNNRALRVEQLTPAIRQTFEDRERALFDPALAGRVFVERDRPNSLAATVTNAGDDGETETVGGSVGVRQRLPTGTDVGIGLETARDTESGRPDPRTTRAEVDVTQALLRGRPVGVNLAALRQARLDTQISRYELRGFAEALVAEVERAYWEHSLVRRQSAIVTESLTLAEQQLREIEHRIRVGDLPETELAAAQAEVALRREALINTRSGLARTRLQLIRLIDPGALTGAKKDWALTTEPVVPDITLGPLESHLELALRQRPDLNQARLQLTRGDLELVKTRNGLLPKLDLFVTLGDTAYASSFHDSMRDIDGRDLDLLAGLTLEYPFGNREARSTHKRSELTRSQAGEALQNMIDLVHVDVESGYIEVERTREQVTATATTRRFQEEKLRAEMVKFKVGRSTALLVAQAQRDLLVSQVSESDAVVKYLQAMVALFRLEGSLLDRRGLSVPVP